MKSGSLLTKLGLGLFWLCFVISMLGLFLFMLVFVTCDIYLCREPEWALPATIGIYIFIGFQIVGLILKRLLTGSFRSPNRLLTRTLFAATFVLGAGTGAYFSEGTLRSADTSTDRTDLPQSDNTQAAAPVDDVKEREASRKDDVQPATTPHTDGTHPSGAPDAPCDYASMFLVDEKGAHVQVTDIRQCYKVLREGDFGDPDDRRCLTYNSARQLVESKKDDEKSYTISGSTVVQISYKSNIYSIETSGSWPRGPIHSAYYNTLNEYAPVFDDVRYDDYKNVCNFEGDYDCLHGPFSFSLQDPSNPFGDKRQQKRLSTLLRKRFRPLKCAGK
jgi:hypothetical protein